MTDFVAEEAAPGIKQVAQVGKDFLAQLIGKTVDQARKLVQDSGLQVREVNKGDMVTMEVVDDRVTLYVEGGTVDSANAG